MKWITRGSWLELHSWIWGAMFEITFPIACYVFMTRSLWYRTLWKRCTTEQKLMLFSKCIFFSCNACSYICPLSSSYFGCNVLHRTNSCASIKEKKNNLEDTVLFFNVFCSSFIYGMKLSNDLLFIQTWLQCLKSVEETMVHNLVLFLIIFYLWLISYSMHVCIWKVFTIQFDLFFHVLLMNSV